MRSTQQPRVSPDRRMSNGHGVHGHGRDRDRDHVAPPRRHRRSREPPSDEDAESASTPICRCRVLYLGSAVPHVTKDGLQGIQEPLRELYPEEGAHGARGIDSWLSVWSNGFLLENVDENRKRVTRFFPIESLHYCAAVRYVLVPGALASSSPLPTAGPGGSVPRFLPLDSPFARNPNVQHPPLFAAILRRTTGIKVLECHVFICKRETAANALVRCAFHAYADSTYAKHLETGGQSTYGTLAAPNGHGHSANASAAAVDAAREYQQSVMEMSDDSIHSIDRADDWMMPNGAATVLPASATPNGGASHKRMANGNTSLKENGHSREDSPDGITVANGDDNHKVWPGKTPEPALEATYGDYGSTLRSFRSSASGLSHRNRPRQMMMPASPPPPPIPEELQSTKDDARDKAGKKHHKGQNGHAGGSASVVDGPVSRKGMPMAHHPMMAPGHPMGKAATFSARRRGSRPAMPAGPPPMLMFPPPFPGYPPMPPHLMPPPGHPIYGVYHPGGPSMEEPIYMPHNARPLSPVASYQPGHFPHEAYYSQQQYATIDKANKYRKNKSKKTGNSKQVSSDSNPEDSDMGMGMGRANGKAAMRMEQRSRSYGSLANGHGHGNGHHDPDSPAGMKAMHQMMSEMELAEERLERSEVPPGLYQGRPPVFYQHGQQHMMMMMPDPSMMAVGAGGSRAARKKR